ncbi:hypothetical protein SAMN05192544_104274 [Paraburkholderia hospita]|nr:hypothetical protein SAMN05192544_104274 [Paraburkholderia hospita]
MRRAGNVWINVKLRFDLFRGGCTTPVVARPSGSQSYPLAVLLSEPRRTRNACIPCA